MGVAASDETASLPYGSPVDGMLALALTNLTSPAVLAFVLGVMAALLRSDLRVPEAVHQALSIYLLLAIGIKGGVALRGPEAEGILVPLAATVGLGIVTPLAAYVVLRWITRLNGIDRGAMAAHYGSTSLVTFSAALTFMIAANRDVEAYVATLLTVLEIPGIVVGLMLAQRHTGRRISWNAAFHEVLVGRSIVLLAGGLLIGALTGPAGYAKVEPFFGALFPGVLVLFLLEMGVVAGRRLPDVRHAGAGLIVFAIGFPMFIGSVGVVTGLASGMSSGGAAVLGVLAAGASYIAAPAAVRLALPEANPAFTLTASLGITFPFNLILGIPLLAALAEALS
jgi:uncharacterized protein